MQTEDIFDSPEKLLENPQKLLDTMKYLFSLNPRVLDELIVDDDEQVWAQIELYNDQVIVELEKAMQGFELELEEASSSEEEEKETFEENEFQGIPEGDLEDEEMENITDDKAHALSDSVSDEEEIQTEIEGDEDLVKALNDYAEENSDAEKSDESDIDFTRDPDELASDDGNLKYEDFFDPPEQQSKEYYDEEQENEEEEEEEQMSKTLFSDEEQDNVNMSQFEKKSQQMKQVIASLEEDMMKDKDWQLRGESNSKARPVNSLLEEDLEFDFASRPAPMITEETTITLEEIIKQRIKDCAWDDVERKVIEEVKHQKPLVDLDKKPGSLAKVYEDEYKKQTQGEEEVKKTSKHLEIEKELGKLMYKLNSLSNFHFTPKPPVEELKVIRLESAIEMEEAIPVAVNDENLLAPQEVYASRTVGELKAQDELDSKDKKKLRRKNKKKSSKSTSETKIVNKA